MTTRGVVEDPMKALFAAGLLALGLAAGPALADSFTPQQKDEIGAIVRDYLLQHPEVLLDVSKELERRQQAADDKSRTDAIAQNSKAIFRQAGDLVAGNPDGDVSMTEFFDYNCAWCKKGLPEVLSLLKSDPKLRLVMKEFPIFGEDSEYAAKAALASGAQGKYWQFHLALLGHEGKVTKAVVDQTAKAQGLDLAKLKTDMASPAIAETLVRNQQLAQALNITGTPGFVIDRTVVPGYLPAEGLAQKIKAVRDAGGCVSC
jgi:protein-disulfide isomerase